MLGRGREKEKEKRAERAGVSSYIGFQFWLG
jgi:hypothetical protein